MAKASQPKDIFSRVQDLGEEALHKLAEAPGGARLVEMANQSRSRLDEMQKRLRGLDVLEQRVNEIERRLDALAPQSAAGAPKRARKPATPKPKAPAPSLDTAPLDLDTAPPDPAPPGPAPLDTAPSDPAPKLDPK